MYLKPAPDKSNFDDVGDFHEKFGLDNTTHHDIGPRTQLEESIIPFRIKFMMEELIEFADAAGYKLMYAGEGEVHLVKIRQSNPSSRLDHEGMFDALIDLVYVAMGTAHFLGYPWQLGWRLVQRANMTKVRTERAEDSKRGSTFDVIKPPGWMPPDIGRLLKRVGF